MTVFLAAEIQKLKHSVSKDNKKKKKEITDKIALLEAELDCRHEKELADLKLHTTGAPQVLTDFSFQFSLFRSDYKKCTPHFPRPHQH